MTQEERDNLPPRNPGQYKFKGIWIPKRIWCARNIPWTEKCLLAEIKWLDDDHTGCTASNKHLADVMDTTEATLANMLTHLRKLGYVASEMVNGQRILRATKPEDRVNLGVNPPPNHKVNRELTTGLTGEGAAYKGKVLAEKKKVRPSVGLSLEDWFEHFPEVLQGRMEFQTAWGEWLQHLKEKRKPLPVTAGQKQLAKLAKIGVTAAVAAIDKAIERNWQGIYPDEKVNGNAGRHAGTTLDSANQVDYFAIHERKRRDRQAAQQGQVAGEVGADEGDASEDNPVPG